MRRPDAARGEDVIILAAKRVQCLDNRVLVVGDDPHFLEVDAGKRQQIGEVADIFILGAAGEKFVADGEHGGGDDDVLAHGMFRDVRLGNR